MDEQKTAINLFQVDLDKLCNHHDIKSFVMTHLGRVDCNHTTFFAKFAWIRNGDVLIRTQSKVKVTPRLEVLEKESTQALIDWKVGMQYQL